MLTTRDTIAAKTGVTPHPRSSLPAGRRVVTARRDGFMARITMTASHVALGLPRRGGRQATDAATPRIGRTMIRTGRAPTRGGTSQARTGMTPDGAEASVSVVAAGSL